MPQDQEGGTIRELGRIVIVSGVYVANDAISNAMRDQAEVLRGSGYEVQLFTHHTEPAVGTGVIEVPNSFALVNHHAYRSADLAIFHFGVHYELFNALLYEAGPRRVVHFHNVTPPSVLTGAARALSEESLRQLSISDRADAAWVVSEHNRDVLLANADVDVSRVRRVGLLVAGADDPSPRRSPKPDSAFEILSVGRFVPAKGQIEILRALQRLPQRSCEISLTLAGSARFSDIGYLEAVEREFADLPDWFSARCLADPSDADLEDCYRRADLFVSASQHEGFCVPVIEALSHGCRVVVTDAGASADTVGPCGAVVPVGDVDALAEAIADAVSGAFGVDDSIETVPGNCREHLSGFGPIRFAEGLRDAVEEAMTAPM